MLVGIICERKKHCTSTIALGTQETRGGLKRGDTDKVFMSRLFGVEPEPDRSFVMKSILTSVKC